MKTYVRRLVWGLIYPVIVGAWLFAEVPEFIVRLLYALGDGHAAWVRGYKVVNTHPQTWMHRRAIIEVRSRRSNSTESAQAR